MLDLETVRRAHSRDMAEVLNRLTLASDDEWRATTPCAGWRVGDLAAHLARGQAQRADALHGTQAGAEEHASVAAAESLGDRVTVVALLKEGNARLEAELARLTDDDLGRMVSTPFGRLPLRSALQTFVMEAGVHSQDVQMAMSGQAVLPLDVIEATTAVLTTVLQRGEQPPESVAYRLTASNFDVALTWSGGRWVEEPDEEACVIEGDDNAVVLFALGRIAADDPGLRASDLDRAVRFKTYLPGP